MTERYRDMRFMRRVSVTPPELVENGAADSVAGAAVADVHVGVGRRQRLVDGDGQGHRVFDAAGAGVVRAVNLAEVLVELCQKRIVFTKPDTGRLAHVGACADTPINPHDNARHSDLSSLRDRRAIDGSSRRPYQRRTRLGTRSRHRRTRVACKPARRSCKDGGANPARIWPDSVTGRGAPAAYTPKLGLLSLAWSPTVARLAASNSSGIGGAASLQACKDSDPARISARILQGGGAA